MRAWRLERTGPPSALSLVELPDPTPGRGEVRIRTHAIGLNFAEILSRKGLYGWAPKRPYTLGMEASGVIDAVGPGVSEARLGESVLVGTQYGCYADRIVVPEPRALPAVASLTLEENAAFGVNFLTAWVALSCLARMRPHDRVMVSAAAGGVGSAAVKLASALGCEVIALAGTEEKIQLALSLGAHQGVSYGEPDFASRLERSVGEAGIDVALETVGGEVFRAARGVLAPFGRIVVAGYASLDYSLWNPLSWWPAWKGVPRMPLMEMARGSNGLMATHLGYLLDDPERMRQAWDGLVRFATEHDIRPLIGHEFGFEQVAEAHALMESRRSTGKIVLRV